MHPPAHKTTNYKHGTAATHARRSNDALKGLVCQLFKPRLQSVAFPFPASFTQHYSARPSIKCVRHMRNRCQKLAVTCQPGAAAEAGDGAPQPYSSRSLYDGAAAVANRLVSAFPVLVLAAAAAALIEPRSMGWFPKDWITVGLALIMLGMGATITVEDLKAVLSQPQRIAVGCALQYSVMPLMGLLVSRSMNLATPFAIGICLVACCPGGTASNVVTFLANADVPLSVLMTTASTFLAVITTPLLTKALVGKLVAVDASALLVSTLQVVLAPVLLGVLLNRYLPRQMELVAPFSSLFAVVMVALVCGSVMAANAQAVLTAGPQLLVAIAMLHAGGFLFGYLGSRGLGFPEKVARTNSIEVGMQNSALGAFLATQHFVDPLTPVPCVISACMHSLMGSMLAAAWRCTDQGTAADAV